MKRAAWLLMLALAGCGTTEPRWCQLTYHFTLPDSMPSIAEALADTTLRGVEPDSVVMTECK